VVEVLDNRARRSSRRRGCAKILHREPVPTGSCISCERYGPLATLSQCGRLLETFDTFERIPGYA
jgi:hypothetical protein